MLTFPPHIHIVSTRRAATVPHFHFSTGSIGLLHSSPQIVLDFLMLKIYIFIYVYVYTYTNYTYTIYTQYILYMYVHGIYCICMRIGHIYLYICVYICIHLLKSHSLCVRHCPRYPSFLFPKKSECRRWNRNARNMPEHAGKRKKTQPLPSGRGRLPRGEKVWRGHGVAIWSLPPRQMKKGQMTGCF